MKDKLVSISEDLTSPREKKASEFPSFGSGAGKAEGAGKLVSVPENVNAPGSYKVSTNSAGEGSSVKYKCGVDLVTGQMTPCAKEQKY